jgi:hypothetical protein
MNTLLRKNWKILLGILVSIFFIWFALRWAPAG